jgi:hypothetical protein
MNTVARLSCCLIVLGALISHAQSSLGGRETKEFSGVIRRILAGSHFAYSIMTIEDGNGTADFYFPPENGELIVNSFKPSDSIVFKARVPSRPATDARVKLMKESMLYYIVGTITAVRVGGAWTELLPGAPRLPWFPEGEVLLNRKVINVYQEQGYKRAVEFSDGVIGYYSSAFLKFNPIEDVDPDDHLSFIGRKFPYSQSYVYPIPGVREVYSLQKLERTSGTIRSLLFKQNNVCIGISAATNKGNIRASFPTEYARRVEKFADGRRVDLYVTDYKVEGQLHLPELHAIVAGRDSLIINQMGFYGGADGPHEYVPKSLSGKISQITRSDAGKIMGIVLDGRTFVEIDANTARQLDNLLRKGKSIEVSGGQRVKKAGEIYSEDYEILAAYQITIDGKVFIITTRP